MGNVPHILSKGLSLGTVELDAFQVVERQGCSA